MSDHDWLLPEHLELAEAEQAELAAGLESSALDTVILPEDLDQAEAELARLNLFDELETAEPGLATAVDVEEPTDIDLGLGGFEATLDVDDVLPTEPFADFAPELDPDLVDEPTLSDEEPFADEILDESLDGPLGLEVELGLENAGLASPATSAEKTDTARAHDEQAKKSLALYRQTKELRYLCAYYAHKAAYFCYLYRRTGQRKYLCQCHRYRAAHQCCLYRLTKQRKYLCQCHRERSAYYCCLYQLTKNRKYLCLCHLERANYYCCLYQLTKNRKYLCLCYRERANYQCCLYRASQSQQQAALV